MFKRICLILVVLGVLFTMVVGAASAEGEPPPWYDNGDERPTHDGCKLMGWEIYILERLAERYEVSIDELEGWYCAGYGFGEIALAYEISLASATRVEEIFAMREEGLSWPEILLAVGLIDEWPPGEWVDPPLWREFPPDHPFNDRCTGDEPNAHLEYIAELYDMPYETVYQWICGPFTYQNFDLDRVQDYMGRDFEIPENPLDILDSENPLQDTTVKDLIEKVKDQLPELPWGRFRP